MATIKWAHDGNGDFNTAADWSSGSIPGPDDTAVIDGSSAAPLTVTISSADDDVVEEIDLFDATLAVTGGDLTVGTLSTNTPPYDTLASSLPVLSVSGGQLTIQQGSTIGELGNPDVVGLYQTGGTILFQNGESPSHSSYLEGGANGVYQTSGTIQVDQGFLHIGGNCVFGGTLAGKGTIVFDAGFEASSTYTFSAGAKLTVNQLELGGGNGTTVILNTNLTYAGIFNVIGPNVVNLTDRTLTLTGIGNVLGGDITGGGTLVIAQRGAAANNPSQGGFGIGGAATLDNKGRLTLGGTGGGQSIFIGDSTNSTALLLNDTTGKLTVTGGQQFFGQGDAELVNNGQMTVTGAGIVSVGADFSNFGTTTVDFGTTLQLGGDNQGGAHLGGTIDGNGIVELDDGNICQTYHLESGLSLSGVSTLNMVRGNLLLDASVDLAGEFELGNGNSAQLDLDSYTLTLASATDTLGSGASVAGSGTLDIATGASADIEGATFDNGAVIEVQGTINSKSGFTLGMTESAALQILAGGVVDLKSDNGIGGSIGSSISNAGTLELTGSGNPAVVGVQYTQDAGAEVLVNSSTATLEFDSNGDSFTGAIDGSGTVELSGGYTYTFASGTTIGVADLEVNNATLLIDASLTDGGGLTLSNGTVKFSDDVDTIAGAVSGTGNFSLSNGSIVTLSAGVSGGETVTFGSGAADLLNLKAAQSFDATIEDFFTVGDGVDLTNFGHSASTFLYTQTGTDSASWTVTDGSKQAVINFAGEPYTQSDFSIVSANHGKGLEIKFIG